MEYKQGTVQCINCHKVVDTDDVGMTKKLVNRGAKQFFCLTCLAARLGVDKQMVIDKMQYFKSIGCTAFPDSVLK